MTATMSMGGGRAGVFWSSLNGGASVALPFLVFTVFARLMGPAEFARFGIALAALEMLKALGPQGIYDVLVTHDESEWPYYQTADAIFLGSALVVMMLFEGLLAASGHLFAVRMPLVMHLLLLKILFDFALMQPQAVLVRRRTLRRLGSRSLVAGCIGGAIGLVLARFLSPMSGLVGFYVIQSIVIFVATVWRSEALAMPCYHAHAAKAMMGQGSRASGVRLSAGVNNYLDQLLIGRVFAPAAVGAYNLGKRLEVVSITLSASFSQILWQPGFAMTGKEERRAALGRGVASVALVCGLPVVVFAVLHERAVPFLFGAQWTAAAPAAALLALSGAFRALGSVAGAMLTVTRRNGLLLCLSLFSAATNMVLILIVAPFGLVATAMALAVKNALHCLLQFALLAELRGVMLSLLWDNFIGPLAVSVIGSALAASAVTPLSAMLSAGIGSFFYLLAGGAAGLAFGFPLLLRRI